MCSSHLPDRDMRPMFPSLHTSGIAVLMHFYFPQNVEMNMQLEALRFWKINYHIDGFEVIGDNINSNLFLQDPYLKDSKLLFEDSISYQLIHSEELEIGGNKPGRIGSMGNDFLINSRRYLKGDEDTLLTFLETLKSHPEAYNKINGITNYNTFSLADLVSYDQKHNLLNQENNLDGTNYNYSWNCGIEGKTRKKGISLLRRKQAKNAISMVLLSQGVPLIVAGDEFLHSKEGNNNTYCQDNSLSWINWDNLKTYKEFYAFVKELIFFRKKHLIFHMEKELRLMDTLACGFPDLSYHGEDAWRPITSYYNRTIGLMYCCKYEELTNSSALDMKLIYVAYNLHWEMHHLALPKLPTGFLWRKVKIGRASCRERVSSPV